MNVIIMRRFLFPLCFIFCFGCHQGQSSTAQPLAKDYTLQHTQALAYCKAHKMNEDFYFLIDLSLHSGKNRFFVYDFKQEKNLYEKLVTHGSCDVKEPNPDKFEVAKYSNQANSHCSAKGKYKIGKRDYSSWGIKVKYWLQGLETSNNNAQKRVIVLHSWEAVADREIYPRYSPLSWGCPAVSNAFMQLLDTMLQESKKPVLLWIL
ncbi:hypothetical protein HMPREF9071_2030 [Capnocytophaga sp. oral taxon 338 str. F0234]|mgnify:CR=1 FL=1|nr:hypothetical protein HMPREF9071_2030 [Capnocytophaga sp. oral taxon 338 str. F0234]